MRANSGQTAAEYMGMLLLVAVVIAALVSGPVGDAIAKGAERAVCQIAGECPPAGGPGGTPELPAPPEPPAPPPVDQAAVDAAVDELRDLLDDVRASVFTRPHEILMELSPAELDAVIAALSDEELDRILGIIDQIRYSPSARDDFYEHLLRTASPETLRRLAQFTTHLQPSFDEVGGDDAADDPNNPVDDAAYGTVPHQLFIAGDGDGDRAIHPNDVDQGAIGDCWLMAGLIAVAQEHPELIEDMIERNPNGTYTVTFMDGDEPVEITVTADVPLNEDGVPIFAEFPAAGSDMAGGDHELWPMIIEKAYARYQGDYEDLEGGYAEEALEAITGIESEEHDMDELSIEELAEIREHGGAIVLSSHSDDDETPLYESGQLATSHAYYVTNVNPQDGTVTIRNPWGYHYDPITLFYEDFQDNFDQVGTNALVR